MVLSSQSVFCADRIVYKLRNSTQENDQFCSMLSASGKTDCFTHCEKSKHKSRGVPPIIAYTRKLRPNCERRPLPDFRCMKGFRISIVEVYERVEKSVSFRSVKGPKRANRRILCPSLFKSVTGDHLGFLSVSV